MLWVVLQCLIVVFPDHTHFYEVSEYDQDCSNLNLDLGGGGGNKYQYLK